MSWAAHLLLELLIEGCHPCTAILLICVHLLIEFLLSRFAKIAVFLDSLLDHHLLVLAFLSKVFLHFSLKTLTRRQKQIVVVNWNNLHVNLCYISVRCYLLMCDQCNISEATLRLSSAACSFLFISSKDVSFFLSGDNGKSPLVSRLEGLRMTSNAWPDARLLSSFTWISVKQDIFIHTSTSCGFVSDRLWIVQVQK